MSTESNNKDDSLRRAKNLQRIKIELAHVAENPSGICRFSYIAELQRSLCKGCDFTITETEPRAALNSAGKE